MIFVYCLLLLGLDFFSKFLAVQYIPPLNCLYFGYPYGGISVFDVSFMSFSLNQVINTGAACGIFQGHSGLLFVLRSAIIIGLIGYLLVFNKNKHGTFPLWLVVTGAIGNGIDYIVYGYVIDFLHFRFWGHSFPIFNFADVFITVGVFLLFFSNARTQVS